MAAGLAAAPIGRQRMRDARGEHPGAAPAAAAPPSPCPWSCPFAARGWRRPGWWDRQPVGRSKGSPSQSRRRPAAQEGRGRGARVSSRGGPGVPAHAGVSAVQCSRGGQVVGMERGGRKAPRRWVQVRAGPLLGCLHPPAPEHDEVIPTSSSFCSALTVVAASGSQATRKGMNATLRWRQARAARGMLDCCTAAPDAVPAPVPAAPFASRWNSPSCALHPSG